MASNTSKLRCPSCGAEMNHHANKTDEPRSAEEARLVNPDLGGVVRELHACPHCGGIASRIALP